MSADLQNVKDAWERLLFVMKMANDGEIPKYTADLALQEWETQEEIYLQTNFPHLQDQKDETA